MRKTTSFRTLTAHFSRMLYAAGSDASQTSTVRALAGVATPMLMVAFWIVALAHPVRPWAAASMHYLFVLYSFCAMGCITALQWERLFPSKADFLILLPLPLRPRTLFCAKMASVGAYILLFLFAANVFGALLFPMLFEGALLRVMLAHAVAVLAAGLASSLAVLALEAAVIVLVPERWFRSVALVLQTLLIAGFVFLFLQISAVGERLPVLLGGTVPAAGRLPMLWFEAMYETVQGGVTATRFAHALALRGAGSLPLLLTAVVLLYPLAWGRRRRMALEGVRSARFRNGVAVEALLHRCVLRSSDTRAIFYFVSKSLARLSRYHVLLAAYCGAGLALALAAATNVAVTNAGLQWSVNRMGAQMALPMLLFWVIAGLRVAFLLPEELRARWIFQMAPLRTVRVVSTVKLFVFAACLAVITAVPIVLRSCGWSTGDVLRQVGFGLLTAVLLIDVFFFLTDAVPFTRPALPERSSLPLTLAVYVFGLPMCALLMVTLERWVGMSQVRMGIALLAGAAVHALFGYLRRLPSHSVSADPFLGELDSEVQTLGLSV